MATTADSGRFSSAFAGSCVAHACLAIVVWWLTGTGIKPDAPQGPDTTRLVWISMAGEPGGGGGGGERASRPATKAAIAGPDQMATPPPAAAIKEPEHAPEPEIAELVSLPAKPTFFGPDVQPGMVSASTPPLAAGLGPGDGTGAGTGTGAGSGSGVGSGIGEGFGGGVGGGAYRSGGGVTAPVPLQTVKPAYTPEAMRARIAGVVVVECVVDTNGQCNDARVARGLDRDFGLNEQAIIAARKWRFRPGTRLGEPVPVWVLMELEFRIF